MYYKYQGDYLIGRLKVMKNIIGFFIMMLLIGATLLPLVNSDNNFNNCENINENIHYQFYSVCQNSFS